MNDGDDKDCDEKRKRKIALKIDTSTIDYYFNEDKFDWHKLFVVLRLLEILAL